MSSRSSPGEAATGLEIGLVKARRFHDSALLSNYGSYIARVGVDDGHPYQKQSGGFRMIYLSRLSATAAAIPSLRHLWVVKSTQAMVDRVLFVGGLPNFY